MNEVMIQEFTNQLFGNVNVLNINNEPWFIGKEIASILGYVDTDQALRNHIYDEDKLTRQFNGSGQNRNMIIINESGLYSLIFGSKLPAARDFKRWVTSEVLPTMRKIGFDKAMEVLQRENAKLRNENLELNQAYDGLRQSFANQSVDFAYNTEAKNKMIDNIMSCPSLSPVQKQSMVVY